MVSYRAINKKNGANSAESNVFEAKVKIKNEMNSSSKDSYRPVIKGFVQCQLSSEQLVQKNGWEYQVKSDLKDIEYPSARSPLGYRK